MSDIIPRLGNRKTCCRGLRFIFSHLIRFLGHTTYWLFQFRNEDARTEITRVLVAPSISFPGTWLYVPSTKNLLLNFSSVKFNDTAATKLARLIINVVSSFPLNITRSVYHRKYSQFENIISSTSIILKFIHKTNKISLILLISFYKYLKVNR